MQPTILLADDSPTIRRLVTQTFADVNFRIVEVSNGDAAIRTFEEVRPNVVLADIYMPGKNGYQVCAYVRSHSELNRTPVVLLVGAFEAFDEETAKQSGATASITKPFEPAALVELVKSVMLPEQDEAPVERSRRVTVAILPDAEPVPQSTAEPATQPAASAAAPAAPPVARSSGDEADDLLGLATIFKEEAPSGQLSRFMTEDELDRIADRVLQKLSAQVIENIAWEILPDITEKVVREELKRVK
jgi:CheY-like chemotaxis protein